MALPNPPQNPNTPIPNNPFFAPLNPFVCGPYFPVAVSAGIDMTTGATVPKLINDVGNVLAAGPGIALNTFLGTTTITATGGGGGSGTVTSITAGTGLTGGIITTSGTIALANTAVTAGAYTAANITVDAQGRITAAANGSSGIPCSTITGKGALVTGTAASTPVALAVGTDGYVLTACAACTAGLTWVASSGATPATPIVEGIVYGCTDGATSFNTALGYNALLAPTALGIANVAIGTSAGNAVTDGYGNTLIGPGTGCAIDTGTVNTGLGIGALSALTSGFANVGVGICSGCAYTTESGNAVLGGYAGDPGDTNSLILSDGAGNLKAKFDSLGALSFDGASYGAIGEVLSSNGPGATPTWIAAGGASPATPDTLGTVYGFTEGVCFNTGFGEGAFLNYGTATGERNTFIGAYGGAALLTTASRNSGVGQGIFGSLTSGCNNTAMGDPDTSGFLTTGCSNSAFGSSALLNNVNGSFNVGVGYQAGSCLTTGSCNVAIGPNSQFASNTGSCQLAIGFSATDNWLTGTSTKAIKPGAGIIDCAASTGTAGQVLMSNGSNAICWGTASGGSGIPCSCITAKGALITGTAANTPTTLAVGANGCVLVACSTATNGICWGAPPTATPNALGVVYGYSNPLDSTNVAIGRAAFDGCAGQCNVAMGREALTNTVAGDTNNVAIGYQAARLFSGVCFNTAVGSCSMGATSSFGGNCNTAVGYNSLGSVSGVLNTAVGTNALCFVTGGTCNVGVGGNAGSFLSTGSCNTLIGANTAVTVSLNTGSNNTVIGFNAAPAAIGSSNTITLGNASITTIRAQVTTITSLSDARDKTDVTALPVGLDFVNSLNPVKFTWQMREANEVKDGTSEAGFIAQDLQVAQETAGADYLGLVYDENPERLEASAGKLIPVLVKAIQELSAKVEALEAKLASNG